MAKIKDAAQTPGADQTLNVPNPPVAPAAAAEVPTTPTIAPEPTNDAIEAMKAKRTELAKKAREFEPDSKEENDIQMERWNIGEDIKREIAKLRKEEADNKAAELRNARVKLFDDAIAAYDIAKATDATDEQKDAYSKARETVVNILLSGYKPAVNSGAKATTTGNAGSKGQTTAAIRAYSRPFYEGATRENVAEIGKKVRKDLIDQGFNDGTMNQAVLNLERELGLKD